MTAEEIRETVRRRQRVVSRWLWVAMGTGAIAASAGTLALLRVAGVLR